jgi:hypothetical protein
VFISVTPGFVRLRISAIDLDDLYAASRVSTKAAGAPCPVRTSGLNGNLSLYLAMHQERAEVLLNIKGENNLRCFLVTLPHTPGLSAWRPFPT